MLGWHHLYRKCSDPNNTLKGQTQPQLSRYLKLCYTFLMEVNQTPQYQAFETYLLELIQLRASSMILSFPGAGVSFFADIFIRAHKDLDVRRITTAEDELGHFNLLEFDFDKNRYAVYDVDSAFRLAKGQKHMSVVINTPHTIHTDEFKESFFASRVYKTFYFTAYEKNVSDYFARFINRQLTDDQLVKIYGLTGGISRLIKYFAVNPEKINTNPQELLTDETFAYILSPTARAIAECEESTVQKLNLKEGVQFKSEILRQYFKVRPHESKEAIIINKNLTFEEKGQPSDKPLLKIEKDILEHLLTEGMITREKVADIKWGEGSYDNFSDEAINKTVHRLNKKLTKHKISSIPKVGYKLESKDE
jgi:hypothetical protein